MALGTLSADDMVGQDDLKLAVISFDGDDAYPTGGSAAFQTAVRALLDRNIVILGIMDYSDNGSYLCRYDRSSDKLKVYAMGSGSEVANATDLSGTNFKLGIFHK